MNDKFIVGKMNFKPDELSSVLKGIRYLYGYGQKDLAKKLGVWSSSVSRWEREYSRLERRNENINRLLKEIPYSTEELIKYGNIDIKELIEEIKNKYNLSYRKCAEIFGLCNATVKWIKEEKIKLRPYIITKIINRYEEIKNRDKREILYDVYEKRFTSNKKGLYIRYIRQKLGITQIDLAKKANIHPLQLWKFECGHYKTKIGFYEELRNILKNLSNNFTKIEKDVLKEIKDKSNLELIQIDQAKKYPFIIGFKLAENEGSKFEEYVSNVFKDIGFEVFRNPIIADEYFKTQHCIDVFAIKDKISICIECKDVSDTQVKNQIHLYSNRLYGLKEMCSNLIVALNKPVNKRKKSVYKKKGIILLDNKDLNDIPKNPDLLFNFLKKEELKLPLKINSLEDIKKLMFYCSLSYRQIGILIEISPGYMGEILNKKKRLTVEIKNKVERILTLAKKRDIRELHFKANSNLTLSKYCTNINNSLELWKRGAKYNKIINFVSNNHKGAFLENGVSDILRNMGWEVFQNVILTNKSASEKHEIDIYAIKDNKEIMVETKNKLRGWSVNPTYISRELEHKANLLGINKRFVITKGRIRNISVFSRKNIEVLKYDENLKNNLQKILN